MWVINRGKSWSENVKATQIPFQQNKWKLQYITVSKNMASLIWMTWLYISLLHFLYPVLHPY